jgi:hypothetical protein
VYKSKKARDAEAAAALLLQSDEDITEQIEAERARLPSGGTPVTAESFAAWKKARDERRARVIDATTESFVFELTGNAEKIDQFVELMRPIGLVEVSRTGVAAISRGPDPI